MENARVKDVAAATSRTVIYSTSRYRIVLGRGLGVREKEIQGDQHAQPGSGLWRPVFEMLTVSGKSLHKKGQKLKQMRILL